jgi:hypothetical protein
MVEVGVEIENQQKCLGLSFLSVYIVAGKQDIYIFTRVECNDAIRKHLVL